MDGKTLMSFLRAVLSKCCQLWRHLHLPSDWNLKYKYFLNKEKNNVVLLATFRISLLQRIMTYNVKKVHKQIY